MKRSRLKPRSAKRIAEDDARWEVRQTTIRRANGRCEAPDGAFGFPHGGVLDVHEAVPRSLRPGAHLDDTITILLCRAHHGLVDQYPDEAHRLGLLFKSWQYDEAVARRAVPL